MKNHTLLIPLAGEGKRFQDQGYALPKPLIPVSGLPMIIQAAKAMPPSDKQIFLCRQSHLSSFPLGETLSKFYPGCTIIPVEKLTEGQASTCILAKDKVDLESALTIGACDNSMVFSAADFEREFSDPSTDVLVWTFQGNPTVTVNPKMYGWVKTDSHGFVEHVSCKTPISDTPIKDHAIVGAFSYKKGKYFVDSVEKLIQKNQRINGEFYLDESINMLVEMGIKVKPFKVQHYICWGTPDDLRTFNYWQDFFDLAPFHPYKKNLDPSFVKGT